MEASPKKRLRSESGSESDDDEESSDDVGTLPSGRSENNSEWDDFLEQRDNDEFEFLPNGYTFTDRRQRRSQAFAELADQGSVEEIEITPGYTPQSLYEVKKICEDYFQCDSSVYIWVDDRACISFNALVDEEEEKITLSFWDSLISIMSDDDESARKALELVLDLNVADDCDIPRVTIEASISLHPECLRSLFSNPDALIEFSYTNLTPETCFFIFANGNRLSFTSSHFDDEGQAMMEALKQRSDLRNFILSIGLGQKFDDDLPMSDQNFKALLDRKGEDPLGDLSIVKFPIEDAWSDTIAKANVQSLSLIDCEFKGDRFVECLARCQASGVGPKNIKIDVDELCLAPFFKGLETNQHLTSLKLYRWGNRHSEWEVLCHSLARNNSLKEIELSDSGYDLESSGHLLDSISHNKSIKRFAFVAYSFRMPWLCTNAAGMLAKNHTIEEFSLIKYEKGYLGLEMVVGSDIGGRLRTAVAPFLARNVMQSRIRALKYKNASPALVGAALAKVSGKETTMEASLLWLLLSNYSGMVAAQFS